MEDNIKITKKGKPFATHVKFDCPLCECECEFEVPRSWMTPKPVPIFGSFQHHYSCSCPECRLLCVSEVR